MARMYSRRRGKSGSTKPLLKKQPSWVRYKQREVELLVVKLGKDGLTPTQIGIMLRDSYGIPDVKLICNKSISIILEESKLLSKVPNDMVDLIRKAIDIRKHMESNKKDMTAKRGLQLTESKINRLAKYYKKTGKLNLEWKYDPKRASFLIE